VRFLTVKRRVAGNFHFLFEVAAGQPTMAFRCAALSSLPFRSRVKAIAGKRRSRAFRTSFLESVTVQIPDSPNPIELPSYGTDRPNNGWLAG
jgi:hypothetical protein